MTQADPETQMDDLRAERDALRTKLAAAKALLEGRAALHRRAQKAEGKLARTLHILSLMHRRAVLLKDRNEAYHSAWMLRAAMAHVRAGSGRGWQIQWSAEDKERRAAKAAAHTQV